MTASCGDPLSVRLAQVVLVTFFRGEGDTRREVLQVFSEEGALLAEHDAIHSDPVYASYFLRDRMTPEMLAIWGGSSQSSSALESPEFLALLAADVFSPPLPRSELAAQAAAPQKVEVAHG